ncbi:chromatin accessibility complex protein 1 isoform X2 [Urocitellus parryii]|uniref:chromatin accessibility complex protein 1 isoform X2 n=1 Tax=Urocitellus parryii TaxID=9999 RepID=UPI000E55D9FD|nr:chromatin accessibility complex protein 1 isoform X2 [Urocitellus parryii]
MPSSSFRCCLPQASTRAHAPSSLDHVAERCRLPPHPRPAFRSARWLCAGAAHHEPPAPTTTPRDYNSQRAAGRWLAQAAVLGGSGKMADVAVGKDKCGEQRLVSLPLSRIRVIMKSSPEVSSINQEALVLTAKATHHLFFSIDRRSQKQPRMRPPGISEQHGGSLLNFGNLPPDSCEPTLPLLLVVSTCTGWARRWTSSSPSAAHEEALREFARGRGA